MYNICLFVSDLNRKTSWGILCASLLVDPTGAARHMSRLANISDDLWLEHPNLHHLDVSWNGKYPQGFSIINQRSWGIPIYGTPESGFFSWFFLRSQYSSSTRRPYDPVANSTSWHVGRALWSSAHLVPLLGTFRTVPSCGQQKQDLIVPQYSTTVPIYQVHSCCRVNTNNGDIFRLHWPLDPVAHMLMMPASSWPSSSKSSWTWGPTTLRWRKESQKHPKYHV